MKQIRGDGVWDDTEAMQDLWDGKPVMIPDGTVRNPKCPHCDDGVYLTPDDQIVNCEYCNQETSNDS